MTVVIPAWLNLENPDGGTLEYLYRELFNTESVAERVELSRLIERTERTVEERRQRQIRDAK